MPDGASDALAVPTGALSQTTRTYSAPPAAAQEAGGALAAMTWRYQR